jgi:DNA-binding YbaB/EbfC family protein
MKDLGNLMKQAQVMQQKLADAQARLAETSMTGSAGGDAVTVTLKGSGEMTAINIDESLLQAGEGEMLADLIVLAHADAKQKLDAASAAVMKDVAGPMAGMIPGMKF